jgi:hypothetical protein
MSQLHVYNHFDAEWVIAASPDDARSVWFEHTGESPEDYEDADLDFEQEPDDKPHKIWCEDAAADKVGQIGEGVLVEKTNAEWAAHFGRSYLCSTEY